VNIFEVLKKRRSIRKYQRKPVEKVKITKVLEAARLGPSAANKQPCHFIIVEDPKMKKGLGISYNADEFVKAPLIIVLCIDPEQAWCRDGDNEEYWKVDAAIALQNLILAATDLGLGTCWIAAFKESEAKMTLNVPEHIRIVAMTPVGYSDEEKGVVTDRKPLSQFLHYDKW